MKLRSNIVRPLAEGRMNVLNDCMVCNGWVCCSFSCAIQNKARAEFLKFDDGGNMNGAFWIETE